MVNRACFCTHGSNRVSVAELLAAKLHKFQEPGHANHQKHPQCAHCTEWRYVVHPNLPKPPCA